MFRYLALFCAVLAIPANPVTAQCACGAGSAAGDVAGAYLPEELQTPIFNNAFLDNGVTTDDVRTLCNTFKIYFPDITFQYVESKPEVNAVAFGDNVTFPRTVELWGGMAKHPFMRLEGIAIILAHEVGHHYGNTDRVSTNPTTDSQQKVYGHGAYCEDQSDFWGTRVGLRILYSDLTPYRDSHHKGEAAYDWTKLDSSDSTKYSTDVTAGIDQSYRLLSGGLFVPVQTFARAMREQQSTFASSGCGHPQAACRRSLYESGRDKAPRATCNNTLNFLASPYEVATNAQYVFEKTGGQVQDHYCGPGKQVKPAVTNMHSAPTHEHSDQELLKAIQALQLDIAEIKAKMK